MEKKELTNEFVIDLLQSYQVWLLADYPFLQEILNSNVELQSQIADLTMEFYKFRQHENKSKKDHRLLDKWMTNNINWNSYEPTHSYHKEWLNRNIEGFERG